MAPVGGGRTATGDTDGTEVTEKSPDKNRAGLLRYKTRPARPKWPFLAGFSHAWRTLYRFRQQEAAHGELCTACEAETGLAITAHQAPLVWRAPEGPGVHEIQGEAAVLVGGGVWPSSKVACNSIG